MIVSLAMHLIARLAGKSTSSSTRKSIFSAAFD